MVILVILVVLALSHQHKLSTALSHRQNIPPTLLLHKGTKPPYFCKRVHSRLRVGSMKMVGLTKYDGVGLSKYDGVGLSKYDGGT